MHFTFILFKEINEKKNLTFENLSKSIYLKYSATFYFFSLPTLSSQVLYRWDLMKLVKIKEGSNLNGE